VANETIKVIEKRTQGRAYRNFVDENGGCVEIPSIEATPHNDVKEFAMVVVVDELERVATQHQKAEKAWP